MSVPELHDDLEGHAANESDRYSIMPGIAGVLIAVAIIGFMFAVADGFH